MPSEQGFDALDSYMGKMIRVAAFDLAQERLSGFSSFRFLYERLLGAAARPWLPAAFCAAAALPQIRPERRKKLLQSISEAAATAPGWSTREPQFFPEWVERKRPDFKGAGGCASGGQRGLPFAIPCLSMWGHGFGVALHLTVGGRKYCLRRFRSAPNSRDF
jgi:hypothetical protein